LPTELRNQLSWSNAIAQVVTEGLKGNPRQVKRMLNALLLRKKLADVAKISMRDEVLAKLMVLEYSHLPRFYELNDWQAREEGRPSTLRMLEAAALGVGDEETREEDVPSEWKTLSLQKWLQMDPTLSDVDLRDYFWLARDRTSSTLAGVNMVSPLVRRLYTSITEGNDGEQEVAAKDAQSLEDSDREALLGLVQQHLSRNPSELTGYNALLKLAASRLPGAARLLLDTVKNGSADSTPAGIAIKLKFLGQADVTLTEEITRMLAYSVETYPQTAFGRAAKTALK